MDQITDDDKLLNFKNPPPIAESAKLIKKPLGEMVYRRQELQVMSQKDSELSF